MININELHLTLLDILNKNNAQYVSPSEIDRFINMASLDYFNELSGAKSANKAVYGRNRTLDRRLNPFRMKKDIPVVSGIAPKPEGFQSALAISFKVGGRVRPARQLDEQRKDKVFDNPLAEPIQDDPAVSETENGFEVYPASMSPLTLTYLKTPVEAKWGFTKPNNRNPVYDSSGSVNLEWNQSEKPQLVMRIANYLGLDIRDSAVVQFTDKEKAQS